MRRAVPIEIRGDRAIHRRQRRLRVGAWRGRRAGRRLRIDGIGRTRERTVHVRHLAPGPLPVPGRSGPALRRAGRTGRADEAHEQPERGDECIRRGRGHRLRNAHPRTTACLRGQQWLWAQRSGGRTGGERSRRRTRNRIRDGEPDERHGTHRLRRLHRPTHMDYAATMPPSGP